VEQAFSPALGGNRDFFFVERENFWLPPCRVSS
jgi:hypothetical protein